MPPAKLVVNGEAMIDTSFRVKSRVVPDKWCMHTPFIVPFWLINSVSLCYISAIPRRDDNLADQSLLKYHGE